MSAPNGSRGSVDELGGAEVEVDGSQATCVTKPSPKVESESLEP